MTSALLDRALDCAVLPGYSRVGFALRKPRWQDTGGRTLDGRVALVTGASSGLGEATCEGLVSAGAKVHMLVRDFDRGAQAVSRIASRVPGARGAIELEVCDLSDLSGVRRFAEAFQARHERLDLLVHNAGVLENRRRRTADGIELTFATNVVGPFLLTSLLLPALLAGAPSRVITVSSGGMYTARLDAEDPQLDHREFDGPAFYAHSKRAQVALNSVWAEQFRAGEIAFHAMHPGWVDTPGLRSSLPRFRRVMRPLLRNAHQGADTIVWLATRSPLDPASGAFWHDRAPRPQHRLPSTHETAADRERLWAHCEGLATTAGQPSRMSAAA
jgi:dehydrogenase/reductase SDR family protein 12